MALPELNDDQRLYLQTIFDYFHEHGQWPTYRYIDRKLTQIRRDLDIEKIAKSLPAGFASTSSYNLRLEDEAILSISAIYLCAGSEEELADFVKTIIFCVERYFSPEEDTVEISISSDDLVQHLNMSDLSIRKVGLLIVKEYDYHIYGQFSCKDNECNSWVLTLTRRIREFDGVTSIEQYLEKLDQLKKTLATPVPILSQSVIDMDTSRSGDQVKVLFLAANPKDSSPLRLDEEIRSIDLALRQAEFRDKFDIRQHWAVRVADIQGYLLRHQPDIVHFSGHGSTSSEIILEDNYGNSQAVSPHALSRLFAVLKDNIRCVVLNACYSERQAQAIAQHIECVIGMTNSIGDQAAINFAAAFYQALGYGRNVKTAFDLGCLQIDLEGLDEQDTPKLLAINSNPESIVFV